MKLVITIVQSADCGRLTDTLVAKGFRSTRISTVGGFLDEPNVTMLIGTEDTQLPELLGLIRQNCHARRRFINASPMHVESVCAPMVTAAPIEVEVGGAAVFVVPVHHIARLGDPGAPAPCGLAGEQGVVILAIVQPAYLEAIGSALLSANYRFTRIASMGGFLKKGSSTLLIGVRGDRVDKVLQIMQMVCRSRAEQPASAKTGPAVHPVTAFIVDVVPIPRPS
jgi:uncharacterized protein YaaQ